MPCATVPRASAVFGVKLLWKLTGGRPMKHIRTEFTDVVVGRQVNSYMDRNGKFWMAYSAWDWGRMRMDGTQIMDALGNRKPQPEGRSMPSGGGAGGSGTTVFVGTGGGGGPLPLPAPPAYPGALTIATVEYPDGTRKKEIVQAAPFQALMAEGLAMLDAAVYPDVSLPDDS